MTADEHIFTLHRYFLWANRHQNDFLSRANDIGLPPEGIDELRRWVRASFVNYAPWFGSLYVVLEGWQMLHLSDPEIDKLLTSPHVNKLKRFRNGVFHFQRKYFDQRFLEMFQNDEGPRWASKLHQEFSRFFKAWFESRGYSGKFVNDADGNEIFILKAKGKTHKVALNLKKM
jgi:hypothetical protein